MSTPSKKRRKAREWMQQRVKEETDRVLDLNLRHMEVVRQRVSEERTRVSDLMLVLPEKREVIETPHGREVRSFARLPSDPYARGSGVYNVPLPVDRGRYSETVSFRPVEHCFTISDRFGDTQTLFWFNWETTRGNKETETYTKGLLQCAKRLRQLRHDLLRSASFSFRLGEDPIIEGVEQCITELELLSGRFRP